MSIQAWMNRGLVVGASLLLLNFFSTTVQAVPISGQGTWETTLQGRLETAPGSGIFQAYYGTDLNITWAANANINGVDSWANQVVWASGLTIEGVSGWRLPTADPVCGLSFNCTGSEMGHLYYTELGNGASLTNTGPFSNLQAGPYWSGTPAGGAVNVWRFNFIDGLQGSWAKTVPFFAWAVHDGDVAPPAAVPEPNTMLLMGSGLVGLMAWRRFRRG